MTGGDIIEITYNHPILGNGQISAVAAEDSEFDLGGFRSADESNMVDGGANMIDKMNRVRWKFSVLCSWDMNVNGELEAVNDLADSSVQADYTISHVNGTVYSGKGKPVGDYSANGNASTFTLTLSGGGKLKKISG